jgi:hypothetical protein
MTMKEIPMCYEIRICITSKLLIEDAKSGTYARVSITVSNFAEKNHLDSSIASFILFFYQVKFGTLMYT